MKIEHFRTLVELKFKRMNYLFLKHLLKHVFTIFTNKLRNKLILLLKTINFLNVIKFCNFTKSIYFFYVLKFVININLFNLDPFLDYEYFKKKFHLKKKHFFKSFHFSTLPRNDLRWTENRSFQLMDWL